VNQVRSLDRGAHILVATPGRLLDLMNQGYIDLSRLEVFVLDEADRMLDMGFLPDLKKIIAALPQKRQSLFFSATMPPKIVELSQRLLTDPVSVNVTPKSTSVKRIQQQVLFVDRSEKQEILRQLLALDDVERAIVFTRTKRGANVVAEKLLRAGITAVAIHGNKSQNARQRALESFRKQEVRVLVATDVAARGIDIDGITHVVNFDMPVEAESYVHRIGRTGRAGADGIALSFCTSEEYDELLAIEKLIDMPLASANERPPMKASGLPRQLGGGGGGGARRVQKVGGSRRPAASGSSRPVQGYGTETFGGTATRTARPPRRGGPQSGRRTRQPS
jgi:ATP-dependent RNA helicase RhlE